MNRKALSGIMLALLLTSMLMLAFGVQPVKSGNLERDRVLLRTNMGDIIVELYEDMPITTGNFKNLTEHGVYDDTIFHRVIDGFVIQGGDPTGTGAGDPSIPPIPDEFTDHNRNDRGTIAMRGHGDGSQFFINLVDNNYLDSEHPVFGRVIEGMDVVDNIAKVETDENDRPLEEVRIVEAVYMPYPLPATIDDLKTEIEELGSEGEIDNQGIVNSLIAKLNVAQKLVDKGKVDQAKTILEAFISQVQNLSGIHITPETADILIESAEYILSHL